MVRLLTLFFARPRVSLFQVGPPYVHERLAIHSQRAPSLPAAPLSLTASQLVSKDGGVKIGDLGAAARLPEPGAALAAGRSRAAYRDGQLPRSSSIELARSIGNSAAAATATAPPPVPTVGTGGSFVVPSTPSWTPAGAGAFAPDRDRDHDRPAGRSAALPPLAEAAATGTGSGTGSGAASGSPAEVHLELSAQLTDSLSNLSMRGSVCWMAPEVLAGQVRRA